MCAWVSPASTAALTLATSARCRKFMPDLDRRSMVAQPDAGRAHHAHARSKLRLKRVQKRLCTVHRAGDAVADPHGQRRDAGIALLQHVEMRVEGRGLEHLREGE